MSFTFGLQDIPKLTIDNFEKWLEDMELFLCLTDLDLCTRVPKPTEITETNTSIQKIDHEKWITANRKTLAILKSALPETVKGSIEMKDTAVEYLKAIKAKFDFSKKAQAGDLMNILTTSKFNGIGSAREHILWLVTLGNKIRDLGIKFNDDFLVTIALNSLPETYKHLKTIYNILKDKWDFDALITVVSQEEDTINRTKFGSANLTQIKGTSSGGPMRNNIKFSNEGRFTPYKNGNNFQVGKGQQTVEQKDTSGIQCFLCKMKGHMKRDCFKKKDIGVPKQEGAKQR